MTYPGIENDPAAAEAANEDMLAVEQRRKEREHEYGQWVATSDIEWGTVKAFTPGMAVPASTVERLKWDELGLVAKRASKAGREVLERTGTATTEEREKWAGEDRAAATRAREAETAAAPATAKTTSKGGAS
jgi:hypothetical protein